ncbi:MAG: anti-sigma factor [Acidobacteria bacterium]|nr:anti-sigma factor [Acidobacteriota bacterium]
MTCVEAEPLIGASLDGELDPQTALRMEQHFTTCASCALLLERLQRLQQEIAEADLDWSAHADLRQLAAAIRRQTNPPWWRGPWVWRSVLGAVAALALVSVFLPSQPASSLERQMVDNHLRSLLANHLVDVPSSDQHQVKPWFQGKLDFAPAVPDLSAQGFVLMGGRLDVVGGRPAAAIVYRRRQHVVNLWVSRTSGSDRPVSTSELEGFHVLEWQKGGAAYWAVSDLNAEELGEFAKLIRSH